jgi:hypothetical protein
MLIKDMERIKSEEHKKREKEAELARKFEEVEEIYQQRKKKEVTGKWDKLEKNEIEIFPQKRVVSVKEKAQKQRKERQ